MAHYKLSLLCAGTLALNCTLLPAQPGPNVIIIVTDDQGYADISAYPHASKDVKTPNMDRLASGGILLTRAYSTSPVSSPARVGIFTGKYPERWGGWRFSTGLPDNVSTLAEYFRGKDYSTCMIGKNDWGRNHGSSTAREHPLNHGYQSYTGFSYLWHEYFLNPQDCPGSNAAYAPLFHNKDLLKPDGSYTTELFTDSAISFINRNRRKPFLLTLCYNAVHDVVQQVPQKYLRKFNLPGIPDYDCKKEDYKEYYDRYSTVGFTPADEMRKYYLASLNCLDDNLGRLLDALDKLKLSGNTLVILIGDNGGSPQTCANNYPLSGSKYITLEGGLRVPMIIRFPSRLPSNHVSDAVVSSLDIVPTCLDAAGINIPDELDGISMLSRLSKKDPDSSPRPVLFTEFENQFAVIDGYWKLVKSKELYLFYGGKKTAWPGVGEEPRLFNLKEDPSEKVDLSLSNPDIKQRLMQEYKTWYDSMHSEAESRGWDKVKK